jgi:hypothetical protein
VDDRAVGKLDFQIDVTASVVLGGDFRRHRDGDLAQQRLHIRPMKALVREARQRNRAVEQCRGQGILHAEFAFEPGPGMRAVAGGNNGREHPHSADRVG